LPLDNSDALANAHALKELPLLLANCARCDRENYISSDDLKSFMAKIFYAGGRGGRITGNSGDLQQHLTAPYIYIPTLLFRCTK
jgi:hypothetical protein